MAKLTGVGVRHISLDELDDVVAQARDEQWRELALLAPYVWEKHEAVALAAWPTDHIFRLSERLSAAEAQKLASLTALTSLDLVNNNIRADGARALASLTALTSLDLSYNSIGDDGARALASLTALTSLNLLSNQIGPDGARALASLTALTSLNLAGNSIGADGARALLDAWVDSPHADRLEMLDLTFNGDLSSVLPPESLETEDAQAILAAYRRFRQAENRPLLEARLLVLGNEAVGKTSLIRYLVDSQPRDPSEQRTPGAKLREKIETRAWSPDECPVRLNVWDFGGQEMYHRTHQFFLSARSLYLLVLEARRQDDRSHLEWLKTIRNRADDAPVIVVINKSDGQHRHTLQLDETGLRRDWPGIVGFVRTSCDPGDEPAAMIQRLRELIVATLEHDGRLEHVRDPHPPSWLKVKEDLAERSRGQPVLKVNEFERLCGEQSIDDPDEQRALLRVLHHLGTVVAHGLDDRRTGFQPVEQVLDEATRAGSPCYVTTSMRHVTLLDPNWLTTAIYSIITDCRDDHQGTPAGEFTRDDLRRILDPAKYRPRSDDYDFILDMMQHRDIRLCFQLPGSSGGRYLLPEALPVNEPEYDDIWPDSLRFRYRYDFLPGGLIPQFIVQAHRDLTEHPTRWRTGVVLRVTDCPVLVRANVDPREIDIKVAGPANRRRDALNVVIHHLQAVHAENPGLGEDARVPLPDQPDVDVSYQHLLRLEARYGPDHEFLPERARREEPYRVRELLEGVRLMTIGRDAATIIHAGRYYEGNDMSENYNATVGDGNRGVSITMGKGINQVTAKKIQDSFNRAASAANTPDEIKTLLQQLAEEVAKIAAAQQPADADETADALETLTKEATREKPRPEWWKLSAKGICEAASTVGAVGTTAIALVDKLTNLLAG